MTELCRLTVTFAPDGTLEYVVLYQHTVEPPTPGTKRRTRTAAAMARTGLETALAGLDGEVVWGGFGTDTRTSRDVVMVERRPHRIPKHEPSRRREELERLSGEERA